MSKLPWSEKLVIFQINPDAADRFDIANMAAELCTLRSKWINLSDHLPICEHNNQIRKLIDGVMASWDK